MLRVRGGFYSFPFCGTLDLRDESHADRPFRIEAYYERQRHCRNRRRPTRGRSRQRRAAPPPRTSEKLPRGVLKSLIDRYTRCLNGVGCTGKTRAIVKGGTLPCRASLAATSTSSLERSTSWPQAALQLTLRRAMRRKKQASISTPVSLRRHKI